MFLLSFMLFLVSYLRFTDFLTQLAAVQCRLQLLHAPAEFQFELYIVVTIKCGFFGNCLYRRWFIYRLWSFSFMHVYSTIALHVQVFKIPKFHTHSHAKPETYGRTYAFVCLSYDFNCLCMTALHDIQRYRFL